MIKIINMRGNEVRHRNSYKIILPILLFFFGIVLFRYLAGIPGVKKAITLAATVKPETFTEMYFENHNDLPSVMFFGGTYNFTFTVRNLEAKDMDYQYFVYYETAIDKQILDQGIISLKNGQSESRNETFGPLLPEDSKVIVELANINQSIYFQMN